MKKSLIALAVLGAFSTIAAAQSSVTLYGRIDQNITYQDPGKNAVAASGRLGKGVTKMNDGGVNGLGSSRWGLRGSEDLGDGLRAYFVLESAISADTGTGGGSTVSGSSFFNRQSYIAVGSKTLGDIRLGRQETITRELDLRVFDASAENEMSIAEAIATSPSGSRPLFQNFGTRIDNAVSYRSPNIGGFQGIATLGLSEDLKSTSGAVTSKAAEYHGLGLVFGQGPLNAAVSYEEYSGGVVSGSYNQVVTVGANYDFGVAVAYAAYQNTSDFGAQLAATTFAKGTDHEAYNVGVKVPYGNFTFKAQFTGSTIDRTGGLKDLDQEKYGLSAVYAFSKRTIAYAAVTARSGDVSSSFTRKNEYVLGLGHNF